MKGYLTDYSGRTFELPVLLAWDVTHGLGSPCDCFEISFLFEPDMLGSLRDAVRFRGKYEEKTVFFGVVDEFEVTAGAGGLLAAVRGRGLAALLMDNEAEAAEYYGASLNFILERHVYPWGVDEVRKGYVPNISLFSVASGSSQWKVLEDFVWFGGGVRPRFTRDGVLLLDGSGGGKFTLGPTTAVAGVKYAESRYGVISSVLVKNKPWGISSTVENKKFLARGGNCRRVVNVPRYTYYDAMRHTGAYQIERSEEGSVCCEIELAELFSAFPGDDVDIQIDSLGLSGSYTVAQSRCFAGPSRAGTALTLYPG